MIRRAVKYIFLNLNSQDLNVDRIAREALVSKNTLEKKFVNWFDCGVATLVRRFRMEQAKRLLLETDEMIADIAFSLGYDNYGSFEKAFKKEVLSSPHEFRMNSKILVKMTH
jgi:AraC-like DNA-binding protein